MYRRFAALLLTVCLLLTCAVTALAIEFPCEGVANASSVRIRKKTSTTSAKVATLDKGESITVHEEIVKKNGDTWYRVETAKGKQGYILSDYLSIPEVDLIQGAEESPDAVRMALTVNASCSDYNSVGKNWTQYYEWNGVQAIDGKMEAYVAPNVDLSVYARVREQDKKPDTTTEKLLYTPSEEEVANGFSIELKLKVTENGGNYKGNSAFWTITYTFSPIEE